MVVDFILLQVTAPDGGLIYTESNFSNYFPEPLNAVTSFLFFFIAIYWLFKIKGFSSKHLFLSVCAWILFTGGIGGILYHGLRRYNIFIALDWVPIVILCFLTMGWFWQKLVGTPAMMVICSLFILTELALTLTYDHDNSHIANNISYALMGLMILVPVSLYLYKTHFKNGRLILVALISFCMALGFRIIDDWGVFQVGTHFLWHVFSSITTICLFNFIYKLRPETIKAAERYSRTSFSLPKRRQKLFDF